MTTKDRMLDWLFNGHTGLSSRALAAHLLGIRIADEHERTRHPCDAGDLRLCMRMLDAVPALRRRLPAARELSPEWAVLIDHWPALRRSLAKEIGRDLPSAVAPITGSMMRRLFATVQLAAQAA